MRDIPLGSLIRYANTPGEYQGIQLLGKGNRFQVANAQAFSANKLQCTLTSMLE
jgi:hypothetical protein